MERQTSLLFIVFANFIMYRRIMTTNDQILDIIDLKGLFSRNLAIIVIYVYIERESERERQGEITE